MWILHFLPDGLIQFIVHTILILGFIGCVLSFWVLNRVLMIWPGLSAYYRSAQLVSALLMISGIYLEGGYSTEMQWRSRVKEAEARVAEAEAESKKANSQIDELKAARVKDLKSKQAVVREYIDREVTKHDNDCVIPSEFVKAHNSSAGAK